MKLDLEKLNEYPTVLNKEQFREACHISKRTALYLLQSGLVKARNNGKKTRCWQIRKEDIIAYAEDCEKHPFRYHPPENWYIYEEQSRNCENDLRSIPAEEEYRSAARIYFQKLLEKEKDILTVPDVIRITGYGYNSVLRWIHKGELKTHYAYKNKYYIPKIFLYNLLTGTFYNSIRQKCPCHLLAIREIYDSVYCGTVPLDAIAKAGDNAK